MTLKVFRWLIIFSPRQTFQFFLIKIFKLVNENIFSKYSLIKRDLSRILYNLRTIKSFGKKSPTYYSQKNFFPKSKPASDRKWACPKRKSEILTKINVIKSFCILMLKMLRCSQMFRLSGILVLQDFQNLWSLRCSEFQDFVTFRILDLQCFQNPWHFLGVKYGCLFIKTLQIQFPQKAFSIKARKWKYVFKIRSI